MRSAQRSWLGAFVAVNLLIGVLSQVIVIAVLGLGSESDALFASQTIYLVVFSILGSGLGSVLLPAMAREVATRGHISALLYLKLLLPAFVIVSAGVWSVADRLTPFMFRGLPDAIIELTSLMARTYAVVLFVVLLNIVFASARRAAGGHRRVESAEATAGLAFLAGVILSVPEGGVAMVPVLALGRACLACLLLLDRTDFSGSALKGNFDLESILIGLRSTIAGGSLVKVTPLVDRHLGARGEEGELALLSFLSSIVSAFAAIIERSVLAPFLVRSAVVSEQEGKNRLLDSYNAIFIPLTAASVAACVLGLSASQIVLKVAMESNWQTSVGLEKAIQLTWIMSVCLLGTPGQSAASTLYSIGSYGAVSRIAVCNFAISTALKLLLFPYIGVIAIALGAALYQVLNSAALQIALRRELKVKHG